MKLNTSIRKKFRVTNKLKKVSKAGRFRLSIFRSTKNISAQIIDDAKAQAKVEADRIVQGAQDAIDQEVNQAREALRERVSELAVQGAEQILKTSVDRSAHEAMLQKLANEL